MSIPEALHTDIYDIISEEMCRSDCIESLMLDETYSLREANLDAGSINSMVNAYANALRLLDDKSLTEMVYETCIQNDRYNKVKKVFLIDRENKFCVDPTEFYLAKILSAARSLKKDMGMDESEPLIDKETRRSRIKINITSDISITGVFSSGVITSSFSEDSPETQSYAELKKNISDFIRVRNTLAANKDVSSTLGI